MSSQQHTGLIHPKYRPDIDGLRAIAVLAVLVHHAFPKAFRTGYIGVDIFFVISGFLISSILFGSLEQQRFSLAGFYVRRIRRIFPALILVMLATWLFGWYVLFSAEFAQLGLHMTAGAAFVSNLLLWSEAGYFDNASETKPLLHLWSLGIEEQFYILWPLLLWATYRKHLGFIATTGALLALSFTWNIYDIQHFRDTEDFFSPLTRLWELMAGGLLAYVNLHAVQVPRVARLLRARPNWNAVIGLLLIITGLIILKGHHAYPGYRALLPVFGAILLIAAGPEAWINKYLLGNRLMVGIGLISYPLYLWHWPILSYMHIIQGELPAPQLRFYGVLLSLALAWATFAWVEAPFRKGYAPVKSTLSGLIGGMLVITALGFATYWGQGYPQRAANDYAMPLGNQEDHATPEQLRADQRCHALLPGMPEMAVRCAVFSTHPEFMVLGDSHAESLALAAQEGRVAFDHIRIDNPACLPFMDYITRFPRPVKRPMECDALAGTALYVAAQLPSIKTVLLVARGPIYFSASAFEMGPGTGHPIHRLIDNQRLDGAEAEQAYVKAWVDLVHRLQALGKEVVFVMEWPELDFEPKSCLQRQIPWPYRSNCSIARDRIDRRQWVYRKLVDEIQLASPGLRVFDPIPVFCDDTLCRVRGEKLYYQDDDHLNLEGSDYLMQTLLPWLKPHH